jgi:hypothetical protein
VLPSSPFSNPEPAPAALEELTPGDRVTHDRLGVGKVVRVVDDQHVIVDFGLPDRLDRACSPSKLTKL